MAFGYDMSRVDDGSDMTEAYNKLYEYEFTHEKLIANIRKKNAEDLVAQKKKAYDDQMAMETELHQKVASMGLLASQEEAADWLAEQDKAAQEAYKNKLNEIKKLSKEDRAEARKKAKEELESSLENNKKAAQDKLDQGEQTLAKLEKVQKEADEKAEKKKAKKEAQTKGAEVVQNLTEGAFGKGKTLEERKDAIKDAFTNDDGTTNLKKGFSALTKALSNYTQQLNQSIDDIASKKTAIDTRLQGSKNDTFMGSYWDQMSKDVTGAVGVSPYVKQSEVVSKIDEAIGKGIAYNVEQRGFLAAISDKIATTFNVFDSSLLKLVRIQQTDSTAARLGMESAMTAFLNNMYETTEYLSDVATSVRDSLYEAEALMNDQAAVELEYQVQKWLGSLYSVGMSDSAVSSIASTFGKIASGDISGITNGETSNLLLMAANQAGLSVADMLTNGLTSEDTNTLMQAMVNFMADSYTENKDNKVVQQQLAKVFGVSASDLKAATNLSTSVSNIYSNSLSYSSALEQLNTMANTMGSRTSLAQMMTNVTDNFQYTLASGIASNPVLYGTYKIAGMLDDLVGGINIPAISVFGSGVDLNATVADLMRVAALSGSVIDGIGSMISAGSGGGFSGSGMLSAFGVGNGKSVQRGTGAGLITKGATVSESGYVGNSDSSNVTNKTLSDANESADKDVEAEKEDEDSDIPNKTINENVVRIYSLLSDVANGAATFNVKVADYGITWTR